MKKLGVYFAMGTALGLSACAMGGTAVGNDNQTAINQYPIETAMRNIYTQPRSESLYTTIGNQTASADIRVTPKGQTTFNNKTVQAAQISTVNKINNLITDQSTAVNYYTLNPLTFHGFTDSKGQYSKAVQTNAVPKIATIGTSKPLITENVYSDVSMTRQVGQYRQSWSLEQNSADTAWLCIDTSDNLMANTAPEGSSQECYSINKQGDILDSRVTINQPTPTGVKRVVFNSQ